MRDLHTALTDIRSIRRQLAHTTEFRGYGPATLLSTAILALAASAIQSHWLTNPATHIAAYVILWFTTATLSAAIIAIQTFTRTRRIHSGLADEMIRMAVLQFLPAAVAGACVTLILVHSAAFPHWMLPGLWQIIFSLGVFASCRFLPRPMAMVGVWYLLTGLGCLAVADDRALSPWVMGIAFAVGQALVAAVLLLHATEAADEA